MNMRSAEFETYVGDDDIPVTVIYEYTADSDETGDFIETNLIKVFITSDISKTDIQSLVYDEIDLDDEAYKALDAQKESDLEDMAASRSDDY